MAGSAFNLCELYNGISQFRFKKLLHGEEKKENTFHIEDIPHMCRCTVILNRK